MSYIKSEKTNFAIYNIILQEAIDDIKQKIEKQVPDKEETLIATNYHVVEGSNKLLSSILCSGLKCPP